MSLNNGFFGIDGVGFDNILTKIKLYNMNESLSVEKFQEVFNGFDSNYKSSNSIKLSEIQTDLVDNIRSINQNKTNSVAILNNVRREYVDLSKSIMRRFGNM